MEYPVKSLFQIFVCPRIPSWIRLNWYNERYRNVIWDLLEMIESGAIHGLFIREDGFINWKRIYKSNVDPIIERDNAWSLHREDFLGYEWKYNIKLSNLDSIFERNDESLLYKEDIIAVEKILHEIGIWCQLWERGDEEYTLRNNVTFSATIPICEVVEHFAKL